MENFTRARKANGIYEFKHGSGLTLLLVPQNGLKVTTANITYRVGSRNEGLGVRGATHYLEHGMFKGSKKFNKKLKNGMWKLEEFGAYMNATTYTDRTNYFAVIDSDKLNEVIMREADRMFEPLLDKEELKKEMTVVRNEFERGENNDFEVLQKRVMAMAFMAHPYHHSTIGWKSEIEGVVETEALKKFHDTFYKPNNATYTFVGNFDSEKVMQMVHDEFSKFDEEDQSIPDMYTTEPLQMGQRRVNMQRPTNCALMCISFKAPNGLHEDAIALKVIANMISKGPNALSQTFKKDESLPIHDIIAEWERMRDPYLFSIWGTTNSPTKSALQQTEECIEKILKMFHDPSTMTDLMESSKGNIKNGWDNEMLGTRNTAMAINEAIARGDAFDVYRRYELLEQVNLRKIQDVAKKYFDLRQSTVGWLWPGEVPNEIVPTNYDPLKTQTFATLPSSNTSDFEASNDVFTKYGNGKADVRISLQSDTSSVQNYICNYLLSQLMTRGFTIENNLCSEEKLYKFLQDKNIQRAMSGSVDSLHVQASIPVSDLETGCNLLLRELKNPILDKSTFEYLKKKWCSELYGSKNNVNHMAKFALNQALFQKTDPNYRYSFDEIVKHLNSMTYQTLKDTHSKLLTAPRLVTLVSPKGHTVKNHGVWKRNVDNHLMKQGEPNEIKINGKSSTVLRYGMVVEYSDALKLAVAVLGNGFTGRLMRIVRDECGYTYGINASLVPMKGCAVFQITGTFSPTKLKEGTEKTEEVIKEWLKNDLTEEEVRVQKSETIGSKNVQFDAPGALASAIHHTKLMYGSVDRINKYETIINKITLDEINAAKGLISFEKLSKVRVGSL